MQLQTVLDQVETLWPLATKEEWDRPGLMLGNPTRQCQKILLSVDVTSEVLDQAVKMGADLIISHHPMFLRGVHELSESNFRGANVAKAVRAGLAIYSAHTNADFQTNGVTHSLARAFGLEHISAMEKTNGHGFVGKLPTAISLVEFASKISKAIPSVAAGLKVAGEPNRAVQKVAVLGGAGDSYLSLALDLDIDVYITSDLRHHPAQDFAEQSKLQSGPALIDIAHWAAEWMWLDTARAELSRLLADCEIVVSEINTDPWTFAVMQ